MRHILWIRIAKRRYHINSRTVGNPEVLLCPKASSPSRKNSSPIRHQNSPILGCFRGYKDRKSKAGKGFQGCDLKIDHKLRFLCDRLLRKQVIGLDRHLVNAGFELLRRHAYGVPFMTELSASKTIGSGNLADYFCLPKAPVRGWMAFEFSPLGNS